MASACVNNVGMLPETFLDCSSTTSSCPSYGWFSPRISFSRDFVEEESSSSLSNPPVSSSVVNKKTLNVSEKQEEKNENDQADQVSGKEFGFGDFEFRLEEDPVKMLPADELFSDGKLVTLQLSNVRTTMETSVTAMTTTEIITSTTPNDEIQSPPETAKAYRRGYISDAELYLFSPKAPRCSSRWKELLGLKKLQNSRNNDLHQKNSSSTSSKNLNSSSLTERFRFRHPKSSSSLVDSSLNLPLLKDSDSEIVVSNSSSGSSSLSSSSSISSSSSSSSSSLSVPNLEEQSRFSLDSDPKLMSQINLNRNPPRARLAKSRQGGGGSNENVRVGRSSMHRVPESNPIPAIGLTIDSPRMNSSGKIVFQSLERSSSSPSTFNGGPRLKHRGVERSYSANVVRVTPVLNVPVCSLRGSSKSGSVFGFGQLFSNPPKRDGSSAIRTHNHNTTTTTTNRNRTDRIN